MVEVPEHLLKRSREARAKATGEGGGDEGGDEAPAQAESSSSAPAPSEAAQPVKAAAPPAPVTKPDPPEVVAFKQRPKVPAWVAPVLIGLPLWAILYAAVFQDPGAEAASGPIELGAEVYSQCQACHGNDGGGGVGPPFTGGEAQLTFPTLDEHVDFVATGSATGEAYGAADRPGGQRVGTGGMPPWGESLTEEELFAVVCYERVTLSGGEEEACTAEDGAAEVAGGSEE